jgi:ubiquinone/menaquinone biosynthesis C-methylase UbiE
MAEKFDPRNWDKLEDPERLVELPPANLIKLLDLTGAETVVDYGAGTGVYSLPVADALPNGVLVAVEEHGALLERLRDKVVAATPAGRVQAVQTTENQVPLSNGDADRVFMINVLHHIHDEPAALAEVFRLLAPGGRLVSVDFAQMDRPVGPPNDHVLALDQARGVVAGMGLRELAVYEPGEIGRYSIAIVAEKAR